MHQLKIAVIAGLFGLTACDITHPVAVVGPTDTVYRGTATASLVEGGWFQVSNGNNSCQGRFRPASENQEVTFPVTCSNGLSGIGTARYQTARSGGGTIAMQNGTQWRFIFGTAALSL